MDLLSIEKPKNSSDIFELFLGFSKLFKLTSHGSFSNENLQNATNDSRTEDSEENYEPKIHPQPLDGTLVKSNQDHSAEAIVLKLFNAISSLKSAYVQLQQAHIPYEPKKIQLASELMVSVLDSLSKLEASYVERRRNKSSLCLEDLEHEQHVEELQLKMQAKECEILCLRREVKELDRKNSELKEKIKQKLPHERQSDFVNREWNPCVFSDVFILTSKSIHDFTKPLISLMKASGWDLDRAAYSIEDSIIFAERSHKKYAFESYVSHVMLDNADIDCFKIDYLDQVMRYCNPLDVLMEDPNSDFGKFCRSKYVVLVKSMMESSFFGNSDQRKFVLRGGHPRTPFYMAFVKMARWVWALQVMARSFIPKSDVFYTKKGKKFEEEYMESVVNLAMDREESLQVGLTVMPGFKIGREIIRCRVYPCKMKPSTYMCFEQLR